MTDALESVLAIAGEPSGDLHGAKVVAKLGELDPRVRVFGIGGDRMRAAGMDLVRHADEFSVVGFAEIVRHLPRLRRAMDEIVHVALERSTRLAVLIDYPGFNLMLARRLRASGVRVLYYISPQVWAWAEGRVRKIAERVDRMAVILPFEVGFYRERGVDVEFVGHPLLEEPWVAAVRGPKRGLGDERTLGLLPGSRRQEVSRHAGVMLGAARLLSDRVPGLRVAIGLAPGIDREDVLESAPVASADLAARGRPGRAAGSGVEFVSADQVHDLMVRSTALIVASGTATLEAACAGTPMVITYRTSALSYSLAKSLVRIPYIGLVNVIAGEEIVPEAVQSEATPERLASLVEPYLVDAELATETSARLFRVRESLGEPGASDRVARMVLDMLAGAAR